MTKRTLIRIVTLKPRPKTSAEIRNFIALRKYETLSLHALMQGFRTSDCEWLMPDTPGARKQARVSVSDSLKRAELLQEFIFWYFDGFLLPLLKVRSRFLFDLTECIANGKHRQISILLSPVHIATACFTSATTTGIRSANPWSNGSAQTRFRSLAR